MVIAAVLSADAGAQTVVPGPAPPTAAQPDAKAKAPKKPRAQTKVRAKGPDSGPTADDAASAAARKRDPKTATAAVDTGVKHFTSGRFEPAIQSLSAGISTGALPAKELARALMTRGLAYRRTGKAAMAISDLTSSLYVKGGLSDADKSEASQALTETYREAGMRAPASVAGTDLTTSRVAAAPTLDAPAALPPSTALAPQAPSPQIAAVPTNLASFFGGLFGGGQRPSPQPSDAPASAPALAPQPAIGTGWSSSVRETPRGGPAAAPPARAPTVPSGAAPLTTAAVAPQAAVTAPPRLSGGAFRAQIGLVRTQQEAQALQGRLDGALRSALQGARTEIDQIQVGAMGAFFRVRVGPYASAPDAQAACQRLQAAGPAAQGLDCVAVGAN